MKPKIYKLINMAVEEGVRQGWYRAHKHVENPCEQAIKDSIESAVMSEIHEYFSFDDDGYV